MRRHALLPLGLLAVLIMTLVAAFAYADERVYRLGFLSPSAGSFERIRTTTFPELARLGFVEGRNLVVETRFGTTEQLPRLARELAATQPDVVLAVTGATIRALFKPRGRSPERPAVQRRSQVMTKSASPRRARDRAALRAGHVVSAWIMSFVPDVTAHVPDAPRRSQMLREQAERCRRLARATTDREVSRRLLELAEEFEERAAAEEGRSRRPDEPP